MKVAAVESQNDRRTVLVTGAASGIGRAVAVRLESDGYRVVAVDRYGDGLRQTMGLLGGHVHASSIVDVTDLTSLTDAIERHSDADRPLRAAVAVAGIEVLGGVLDLEPSDWQRSLDINLTGVFNTAKACMPSLVEEGGSFVAMASDAGHLGAQGYSAYCAAKHGVIGLIKAMALDYGPSGVRSNAVAPSFVHTPMAHRIFEDNDVEMQHYAGTIPLGRFASPEEVAAVTSHLVGNDASYSNGMVYKIDGGSTAGYFVRADG